MSECKNRIEINIGGHTYTLVGQESQEYMHMLAAYIDKKMDEIRKADWSDKLSKDMMCILTSLNVADDYFKSKATLEKMIDEISIYNEHVAKHDEELADAIEGRRIAESQIKECEDKMRSLLAEKESEHEKMVTILRADLEAADKRYEELQQEFERFTNELDKATKENIEYEKLVREYQLDIMRLKGMMK